MALLRIACKGLKRMGPLGWRRGRVICFPSEAQRLGPPSVSPTAIRSQFEKFSFKLIIEREDGEKKKKKKQRGISINGWLLCGAVWHLISLLLPPLVFDCFFLFSLWMLHFVDELWWWVEQKRNCLRSNRNRRGEKKNLENHKEIECIGVDDTERKFRTKMAGESKLEWCASEGGEWVSQGTFSYPPGMPSFRSFFFMLHLSRLDFFFAIPSLVGCSLRHPFLLRQREGTFPFPWRPSPMLLPFLCVFRFPIHQGD